MTTEIHDHTGRVDCPVCLVRALTEGEPDVWWPGEPASVKGVVLQVGRINGLFTVYEDIAIPYVDLWLGGTDRIRVLGYGSLGREMDRIQPTVGDTLTVAFTGMQAIKYGRFAGKMYRAHSVELTRGHH